jgi:hypothetical protein
MMSERELLALSTKIDEEDAGRAPPRRQPSRSRSFQDDTHSPLASHRREEAKADLAIGFVASTTLGSSGAEAVTAKLGDDSEDSVTVTDGPCFNSGLDQGPIQDYKVGNTGG